MVVAALLQLTSASSCEDTHGKDNDNALASHVFTCCIECLGAKPALRRSACFETRRVIHAMAFRQFFRRLLAKRLSGETQCHCRWAVDSCIGFYTGHPIYMLRWLRCDAQVNIRLFDCGAYLNMRRPIVVRQHNWCGLLHHQHDKQCPHSLVLLEVTAQTRDQTCTIIQVLV